ncbi:MAG: tetratricopeptide repeat protein [Candidatus Omnitrophota bacterium]|nr:MAG: tetratricopeptide repeat protein [Candidatus Omnitrophota bacterium]
MTQKILVAILVIWSISIAAVAVSFYLKGSSFQMQLDQSDQLAEKLKEDIKRLEKEKKTILEENQEFQADAVYYTKFTTQLQEEIKKLKSSVEGKDINIENLSSQLELLKSQMTKETEAKDEKQDVLAKEHSELKAKVVTLEETLRKERGFYYYNLGVSYVQAKLFSKAVEAYEKSLSFEPKNAEAHYNLGLLYENFNLEPEKAILHYQKYLELKPEASDKQEVLNWINRLKDVVYQQVFPEGKYSQ